MKLLILTTKYRHPDGSSWLVSELAEEFISQGHSVTVVNLEWFNINIICGTHYENGVCVVNVLPFGRRPSSFGLFLRWGFSALKLIPLLVRAYLLRNKFDLLVSFSPCSVLHLALPFARAVCKKSILIYWDFFPIHNYQISNKIPHRLLTFLKYLETKLISGFDRIGCMDDANVSFFLEYFGRSFQRKLFVVPVWLSVKTILTTDFSGEIDISGFSRDRFVFVYGGQLVDGRNIASICEAAIRANFTDERIAFVVAGEGPLSSVVTQLQISHPDVIHYVGSLRRSLYFKLLSSCDVGVVVTDSSISSPTFPSKSLDYFALHLPILVAIDKRSGFRNLVNTYNFGFVCDTDSIDDIANAMLQFQSNSNHVVNMGESGYNYMVSHHDVCVICKLLFEVL